MRLRGVPELLDQGVTFERLLHDTALYAFAPAVNQPDLAQAGFVCGVHVFLDNGLDVARGEGVEIEGVFYGNPVSHSVIDWRRRTL